MTAEEAQGQTEKRWQALADGATNEPGCGWCEFSVERLGRLCCENCPIPRVFGVICFEHSLYQLWRELWHAGDEDAQEIADQIWEMVVEQGPALIAAAKEIEKEVGPRH